jgi:hypothetical protein
MSLSWRDVDPELLRQPFRDDIDTLLHNSPYVWVALYGYRGLEEQYVLYQKFLKGGPRAAPPGRSAHNYGLALDVALDGSDAPGLQADWNTSHPGWAWLFDAVWKHPRLHSGRSFNDADHVEALGWKALK